ncbi:MAG: cache domain-containing protein [Calditrichaceae bacterium]|nr:cache domain-containing protein [Calditrichaceae bacterium]MBN2708962.1 cache domain-containing protein [Calditrichaceae bacterium]RQV97515.1 MAG: HAMP domain-containing protein [Calditrichota bacterium]
MKLSYRMTQMFGYSIVITLMALFTIFTGYSFISNTIVEEAKLRVQMDLNSAWFALNEEIISIKMTLASAAQYHMFHDALSTGNIDVHVLQECKNIMEQAGLDYCTLITSEMKSVTDSNLSRYDNSVIRKAFAGNASAGILALSCAELKQLNPALAEQAAIPLIKTEHSRSTDKELEDRGMVIGAAVPIFGPGGKIQGVIYGGFLLNRKYEIVDKIRNAVFGNEVYNNKPLGTVTLFLWDVRVATNVIKADAGRAIGTRVSDEVYEKVLVKGEHFGNRAFVVNDWYLSAYDPIRDINGEIIGILYVGLLEEKYLDYRSNLIIQFLGISFFALILVVGLSFYLSGSIRRPVYNLVEATRKLARGELSARVKEGLGSREMKELAHSFNVMAGHLEKDTIELNKTSLALKKTLSEADEKNRAYMEMLGFVTHELKSPLASIVFTIGALRDKILGPLTEQQETTLKSAANSADYLYFTIENYLNLNRIEEGQFKIKVCFGNLCKDVVEPVLNRLSEMALEKKMEICCELPKNIQLECDLGLLGSVFQNLLSNAIKYGKTGGKIFIKFEDKKNSKYYKFSIYNEGKGFDKKDARNLFSKFYHFHKGGVESNTGTGLGLFVTKKIILAHGGKIWAESKPEQWAEFTFTLPKKIINQ